MSVMLVSCNLKLGPFVLFVYVLVYYCLYQTKFADVSDPKFADVSDHACV